MTSFRTRKRVDYAKFAAIDSDDDDFESVTPPVSKKQKKQENTKTKTKQPDTKQKNNHGDYPVVVLDDVKPSTSRGRCSTQRTSAADKAHEREMQLALEMSKHERSQSDDNHAIEVSDDSASDSDFSGDSDVTDCDVSDSDFSMDSINKKKSKTKPQTGTKPVKVQRGSRTAGNKSTEQKLINVEQNLANGEENSSDFQQKSSHEDTKSLSIVANLHSDEEPSHSELKTLLVEENSPLVNNEPSPCTFNSNSNSNPASAVKTSATVDKSRACSVTVHRSSVNAASSRVHTTSPRIAVANPRASIMKPVLNQNTKTSASPRPASNSGSLLPSTTRSPLGGVQIKSPSNGSLRLGLSRNMRVKPLHANVKLPH